MKKVYLQLCAVFSFLLFFIQFSLASSPGGWSSKFEPQKVFIENKGQFKVKESNGFDNKVAYAYDGHERNFYFTKSGVVFELTDIKNQKKDEKEEREMEKLMKKGVNAEMREKMEEEEKRLIVTKDELRAQWIGANPNVQIIAEDKNNSYFSYTFKNNDGAIINENFIAGYKKLTYKDLYPNIDVVYEMHPQSGIKYSVIVHPGGDISQVKLQYSKNARLLSDGTVKTKTRFGDFIDHAPSTFYADDKSVITSSYTLRGNVVSFSVGSYDQTKTIVIDPWTQAPSFNTQWQCVWECQKDAAGNVYIIGGVMPMQLLKYNSGGTLQWTYSTPYDTSNCWLGTFAVDNPGNSYVTAGSVAQIEKINTSGGLVWNNSNVNGIFGLTEFWSISFNCDQSQLVVGGTGGGGLTPLPYIYNINMSNGNVLNSVEVTGGALFPTEEVRSITACGNGNYYYLTHDSIGYIHQGLTSCLPPGSSFPFHVSNGYGFGYKCEDFRVNNTGIRAMRSFGGYVYSHRGNQVHKRNFNTGAIIATGTIPGGAFTNSGFGGSYVSNSGIDIDSCGNVYVGSTNGVVKFDANLNQLGTYSTAFNVYDVVVSPTGDVIAAGTTGNDNSGARTGYVQSFAAGACKTIAIVCCDATICPHASVCSSDAPFNLTATTAGGVWSGTGITNATNGTFSPAVSGVGTFTVYYTLACGRDSTVITVNSCTAVTLCRNANGTLTVSGGTAPYTWQTWDSTGQVCQGGILIGGLCFGGTFVNTYGWVTFSTGAALTVTPPAGTDTLRVIDNAGTTVTSWNIATLAPCVACNLVVSPGSTRNVNCFGASTGYALVSASGGTLPYTYAWSAGGSTVDSANNLAAGTYTVTVHDAGGCTGTASFTITQPAAALSATHVTTPASCGGSNGKAVFTVSGGTPGYTYVWSPNVSTVDSAINLAANTYNVTVTDNKGCTFATSATVTSAAGITVTAGTQTNVPCLGGSTGVAHHVVVTGGSTPYTYTWSPNVSTNDSAVNLAAGTYTVTVHDANGCTGTASYTITQPATTISATNATTGASCGNSNGKVVFTVTGGTPGYTYTWAPNVSTTDSAINLAAGTYDVTVHDANGCTFATSATVSSLAGITVSAGTQTNVLCRGASTGIAHHVLVTGGTTPYTYTWSPNVSTNDSAVNLAAGTYTVTVHDANGCTGTASYTITQPATNISATNVTRPATCGNNNGKVVFTVTGGTPGYSYTWSPNVSTTDSAINLAAGTYNVTVHDANGCTFATSATVSPVAGITVSAGTQTNVLCSGASTGIAHHVVVTGGTTPYTYVWSPNVSTNDSAINLAAGTYNVTVTDANGCTGTASYTITQPATSISATNVTSPATCGNNNGKVVLTVTGGTPGYTYTWSPNVSTVDSAINLAAGTYNVTVHDANGCTFATSATVSPASGVAVSPGPQTNVNCFGASTGIAHVTATGGTTPYTYTWSPNVSTKDSAINLAAGTYTVTVHDANGCTGTASFTIIQPATAVSATTTTVAATCGSNNGKVVVNASGGTPTYTYAWSPNVSAVDSAINLAVGSYTVTVTDNKGCTFSTSASVASSSGFSVSPGPQTNVNCFGASTGVAHVTATGGTLPYTYVWSPNVSTVDSAVNLAAGTYTVTVHDANNCSGAVTYNITQPALALTTTHTTTQGSCGNNNGKIVITASGGTPTYAYVWSPNVSTTDSAVNLGANTYNVTVTDNNGCTATVLQAITVTPAITVAPGATKNVTCFGGNNGAAYVTVTGGTAPLTYVWSPNVSTVDSAVSLTAGAYTVTVSDINGCSGTASFTITQPATALAVTSATTLATCGNNNGKVVLTVTGGTPTYSYTWAPNVSTVDSAVNLAAGTYNVTVQDANGCTFTVAPSVTAAGGVTVSLGSKKDVSCNGGNDGNIYLTTTGGTLPYAYTWSPNVSTHDSAVGLSANTYNVTVQDANGCASTITVTIGEPTAVGVTTSTTIAGCGLSDGTATAVGTGGTGTLTYQWSAGTTPTNAIDNGLAAGTYNVTVKDGNLCTATATAAVSNAGAPTAAIGSQTNINCAGSNTGRIVLNVTGGAIPYTYTWSPNVSTVDSAVGLAQGTYSVTVHDASSCIAVVTATITQPQALVATVQAVNADCGVSNGSAQVNVSGGTGTYTYLWSNLQSTDPITGLTPGAYDVTVTDGLGCQLLDTVIVGTNNGPPAPTITASGPLTFCQGDSVVLTSSAATGNTWSTTATTQSITVSTAGSYTVTQTVGGCTSNPSAAVVVTVNPIPAAPVITASGPLSFCAGDSVVLTSNYTSGNTWSNGATTQSITVYAGGTFTVSAVFGGCPSPVSAPVIVNILTGVQPHIVANKPAICPGDSVTLNATTAGATAYAWNTTATTPIITIHTPGFYQVTMTVNGCNGNDTITIGTMLSLGTLSLPAAVSICSDDSVILDATTQNATSYVWSGGLTANTPVVTVKSQGVYYVTVSNSCGVLTDSSEITVTDCDCKIVVPNAFTPNGDGKNEIFAPNYKCENPKYLNMKIFNRWGEKVYETTDLNGGWDGRYKGEVQPPEVYVYILEFVGMQHNVEKTFKFVGSVTLIR